MGSQKQVGIGGVARYLVVAGCMTLAAGCAGKNGRTEQAAPGSKALATRSAPTTRQQTRPSAARTGTLFERLGGEAGIRMVVDTFVTRAAADPAVNFTRRGHDNEWQATPQNVQRLKQRLAEFIATTAGAPNRYEYKGRDLVTAHKGMAISNAEFDALAGHLRAALEANDVPRREREELLDAVASTRSAVVEVPDQSPTAALPQDDAVEEGTTESGPVTEGGSEESTTEFAPQDESSQSEESTRSEASNSDESNTEETHTDAPSPEQSEPEESAQDEYQKSGQEEYEPDAVN
jgi:hemoglobin